MYLSLLGDRQKEAFMDLAYLLSSIDNDFSDEEHMVMDSYLNELGITYDYEANVKNESEIVAVLNAGSDDSEKKVIIFELVSLAMSDENFDDNERAFIGRLCESFGFNPSFFSQCEEALRAYLAAQVRLSALILY